ncbi:MAG: ABC transporter substrate-binding protein [Eubacteriales bacterium]|nr:ABC transporter substrate-binding protein [Eubacteriales bacterium]
MMNFKKIGALLMASTMALGMLTACGGGGSAEGNTGAAAADGEKVLNFGCYKYSDNFDPAIDQNSAWDSMRLGITECLFKFDSEVVAQPQLCDEIVSESEDMTEFVYHIRDGVKFSNGNPCDAQAVADSLTRLYTVTNSDNEFYGTTATSYADIASVTADQEANTITIKLNVPNYNLEGALCFPYYGIIDVGGDTTDEKHQGDVANNQAAGYADLEVIGTGPYVLESYDETTSCGVLHANENYWKEEVPFDKVVFTHIAEADKKAMALQAGEIDLTENITTTADLDALKGNDNFYVSQCTGVRTGFGYINFKGILANEALRQAILMSIDGQTMADVTVGGMYTYGPQVLPSSTSFDHSKLNNPFAYDPEKATKTLDDAGIVDNDGDGIRELDGKNVEITFITYVNRCLDTFAEACEPAISGLGIKCNVQVVDDQKIWDVLEAGDFDILNNNWTTMGVGDPTPFLKNWLGGDAANYNGYQNDKYDAALKTLETEADDAKREELVLTMEQQLLDDAAVLVHGYYNSSMISNKAKVTGADIQTIDYYWLSSDIKPAQ